ncbi:LysR family transcriptional regulator, partial [Streptococcus pneumoniae]
MTLEQMRYLVALVEERSFTRAAERVYLTQPALSVQ